MVLTSTTITTILVTIQQLYSQLNKYLCRDLYPTKINITFNSAHIYTQHLLLNFAKTLTLTEFTFLKLTPLFTQISFSDSVKVIHESRWQKIHI